MAALLPFAWHAPRAGRMRWAGGAALLLLAAVAYLSGNRMVWASFALMLVAFAVLNVGGGQAMPKTRSLLGLVLAVAVLGLLFFASSEARFDGLVEMTERGCEAEGLEKLMHLVVSLRKLDFAG